MKRAVSSALVAPGVSTKRRSPGRYGAGTAVFWLAMSHCRLDAARCSWDLRVLPRGPTRRGVEVPRRRDRPTLRVAYAKGDTSPQRAETPDPMRAARVRGPSRGVGGERDNAQHISTLRAGASRRLPRLDGTTRDPSGMGRQRGVTRAANDRSRAFLKLVVVACTAVVLRHSRLH
jgi:hypothetical protein